MVRRRWDEISHLNQVDQFGMDKEKGGKEKEKRKERRRKEKWEAPPSL